MKKLSNKFRKGELAKYYYSFLVSSAGVALKLEKVGSIILVSIHFHPRHPLQQMETVSMPK